MTVVDSSMASAELFDQLAPGLDARTIDVIERHRSGGLVQGRGWLVRRALALADIVGLTAAFVIAMVWWAGSPTDDHVADGLELVVFMLSLPVWILAANLYGLYSSDEERTDHSTADDLVARLPSRDGRELVPVPRHHVHRGRESQPPAADHLLAPRDPPRHVAAGARASDLPEDERLPPEHGHRRRRRRRPARRRGSSASTRSTASTSSGSSTRSRRSASRASATSTSSARPSASPSIVQLLARRARHHRVLERLARGDARPHPLASRTSTSRSTSSRACSRSSARTSACTPPKACR